MLRTPTPAGSIVALNSVTPSTATLNGSGQLSMAGYSGTDPATGKQVYVDPQYHSDLQRLNPYAVANAMQQQQQIGGQLQALAGSQPLAVSAGNVGVGGVAAPVANAAQIQQGQFQQAMGGMRDLNGVGLGNIRQLQAASSGLVPSAAELQGRMQLQQAMANTQSMAASARGSTDSRAAAQRQAMATNAQLSGQVIANAQANRAAEQAQARQQLTGAVAAQQGAVGAQAGQYAQIAQNQAALNQQTALANQGASLQAMQGNQSANLAAAQSNQAAQLQAQQLNQAAGLQQQALSQNALTGAGSAYQAAYQNQMTGLDFNNQLAQQDFNRQMSMSGQALQRYGVDKGIALGTYQADQARAAQETMGKYQMYGSIINSVGQLGAGAANYFGK